MYLDENRLIVQKNGDGGDTLQRMGFWFEGLKFNPDERFQMIIGYRPDQYIGALQFLQDKDGNFFRNPKDWNDPKDCSRDQLVPNIRACGYYDARSTAKSIFWKVIKNFSRYPNSDVAFFQDYGRFARTFRAWWAYPIILIGDIFLLGNSIIRCIKGLNYDDVGDDLNHIGDLAQARETLSTPISWAARLIYVAFRPCFEKVGDKVMANSHGHGAVWALSWYFREESGGNPEIAELWKPTVIKF